MKKKAAILTTHDGHKSFTAEPRRKNASIKVQKNLRKAFRKSKRG